MARSRRAIQVAAVAAQIGRDYDERYHDDIATYAAEVNSAAGWIIDVGYGGEAPGNWTRTEGIHLSAAELAIVVGIASREVAMIPVGQTEIAERLGVPLATVQKWRTRHLLPGPSWTVGGRPAWEWGIIERWATKTGRL